MRKSSSRLPRRYGSIEEAYKRMQEENPHLSPERARHLTLHGITQNEDGTYSWKFDNYVRTFSPNGLDASATQQLWAKVSCPTLLMRGADSWASDPVADGRASHFKHAEIATIEKAGHWVHHDQFDKFMSLTNTFLEK